MHKKILGSHILAEERIAGRPVAAVADGGLPALLCYNCFKAEGGVSGTGPTVRASLIRPQRARIMGVVVAGPS